MSHLEPSIDYYRLAWLFAASDRHAEGIRYFGAQQNDACFLLAIDLFADVGAWQDAVPRYAVIEEIHSANIPAPLFTMLLARLAIGRAFLGDPRGAEAAAKRALVLVGGGAADGDSFVRMEVEAAQSIAYGMAASSVDAIRLDDLLVKAHEIGASDPWRVSRLYQDLADLYRVVGKMEVADSLQLKSWSLRSLVIGTPEFQSMEAVASRFLGTPGENDVWEDRYSLRLFGIVHKGKASNNVRAVALERYLNLCARHRHLRADAATVCNRVKWLTEGADTFVESRFQGDHRIFAALIHVAAMRPGKALAILRQRLAYEDGAILNEIAGRPLEEFTKVLDLFEATSSLILAILAIASDQDHVDARGIFGALSSRRNLAQYAEAMKYEYWRAHITSASRDILDEWLRVRREISVQAFHHLIGPHGSVQMAAFERAARAGNYEYLAGVPTQTRRLIMESVQLVMKAFNNTKLFQKKAKLEQELREAMPQLDLSSIAKSEIDGIRTQLSQGEIFVEYIRSSAPDCPLFSLADPHALQGRYYAFVCSRDTRPVFLSIGGASAVDAAIRGFRRSLGIDDTGEAPIKWIRRQQVQDTSVAADTGMDAETASRELFKLLLAPILRVATAVESFTIIGDDSICRVPFQALRTEDGVFVIDRYEIHYVNASRDLVSNGRRESPRSGPIVVAAPDFDLQANDAGLGSEPHPEPGRGAGSLLFHPLPATEWEGAEVATAIGAKLLQGRDATVEAVSSLVSPEVLHVASHGFYFPEPRIVESMPTESESEEVSLDQIKTGFEDPLLRSGVALAGANSWLYGWKLPEAAGTGFLTAQDICLMDLTGTRLVTLSACDTGLGDASIGQGIIGLRQSLAISGARWSIVALWPVPDEATAWLMRLFYSKWDRTSAPYSALRQAQLATRQRFADVRSWAGFVCIGPPQTQTPTQIQFGRSALERLASVPFEELMNDANMTFTPPKGFRPNEDISLSGPLHCYSLVAEQSHVEIRYSVVPFRGSHKARFSETDYQELLRFLSGGPVSPTPFPREGVRAEFGAHAGYTATVVEAPYLDQFAFAAVVYIVKEDCGAALIWYLADHFQDVLGVMNSEFNSLRFDGEPT